MSLHVSLSPEAQKKLRKQKHRSAITSTIIAVLVVTFICVILAFFLLPALDNYKPEIVTYQGSVDVTDKLEKPKLTNNVQRKPSSPSSSMARVIASNTISDIAVPVPEEVVDTPMDIGNGNDFGDGWGGDGWGDAGGGGTTFFGQKLTGKRVLYVIDYSLSMNGKRQKLMRVELAKSVAMLPPDKKFQLIFFAGPAWVAGSKVNMQKKKAAIVNQGGQKFRWISNGKAHLWKQNGKKQNLQWLTATDKQVATSQGVIKKSPLIWGTNWENPLEMAFTLDPLPEVIIFMTDGVASGDPVGIAKTFAKRAKKNNITINTVALMEPKAAEAMEKLAKGTGGSFALINENGKKVNR